MRIYLNHVSHVEAWTQGGAIPISPASRYRSQDRKGVFTPDENIIRHTDNNPDWAFYAPNDGPVPIRVTGNARVHFGNSVYVGGYGHGMARLTGTFSQSFEDGLILSLSQKPVRKWIDEGKNACVEIVDLDRLIGVLNDAIGYKCTAQSVEYTKGIQRNHFLKSDEDAWQCEFRLFWAKSAPEVSWVMLPPGIGSQCEMY
ncbi:MAG: hypothetical protein V4523_05010 [Pseudomonadota bacterium]